MKKIVGVLAIASVIALGAYFYTDTGGTQAEESSPLTATVSESVKAQPENQIGVQNKQEETKKPVPELESFEGLDQESSVIFDGGRQTQSPSEDSLKAATQ